MRLLSQLRRRQFDVYGRPVGGRLRPRLPALRAPWRRRRRGYEVYGHAGRSGRRLRRRPSVRLSLPRRREPSPYGGSLPRSGLPRAAVAGLVVVLALLGGWFGNRVGSSGSDSDVTSTLPLPAAAASAFSAALPDAMRELSAARSEGRLRLSVKTGPAERAAAASALAGAYGDAVAELRPAVRGASDEAGRVVAAMRRSAGAYSALAAALGKGDRGAYARASAAVDAAERELARLIGGQN